MAEGEDLPAYQIWGADNVVYGPVDLPVLIQWVQEERVTSEGWVFLQHAQRWEHAGALPELRLVFHKLTGARRTLSLRDEMGTALTVKPGSLRRIKVFAGLDESQLAEFVRFMRLESVHQWDEIAREGSPGDAMYLILEGEVRVRLMIGGKETILATLAGGEFFGEVALFDHGPRSADVVANTDCLLLKIPASSFQKLVEESPGLAAPFLHAVSRTLIARIRADNKRYRDSIAFARSSR
jgi:hypothetical protein